MNEELQKANEVFEKIRRDWKNPIFQNIGRIWYKFTMLERIEKKQPLLEKISDYMNFVSIEVFFMIAGFLFSKHGLLASVCACICILFGGFLLANVKIQANKYRYLENKVKVSENEGAK